MEKTTITVEAAKDLFKGACDSFTKNYMAQARTLLKYEQENVKLTKDLADLQNRYSLLERDLKKARKECNEALVEYNEQLQLHLQR